MRKEGTVRFARASRGRIARTRRTPISGGLLLPRPNAVRRGVETSRGGLPKLARLAFWVVFAYLIVGFVLQEIEVLGLVRQVRALEAEAADLSTENARLLKEIEYAQTDAYVEQVAREELGLIWLNEIPYSPGSSPSDAGSGANGP
jgi:cell division protein FtsB